MVARHVPARLAGRVTALVRPGPPAQTIAGYADALAAVLVVLGAHTRGSLSGRNASAPADSGACHDRGRSASRR